MSEGLIGISIESDAFENMVEFRIEMSELIIFLQCLETASDDNIKAAFKKLEEYREAHSV